MQNRLFLCVTIINHSLPVVEATMVRRSTTFPRSQFSHHAILQEVIK